MFLFRLSLQNYTEHRDIFYLYLHLRVYFVCLVMHSFQRKCSTHEMHLREWQWIIVGLCEHTGLWSMASFTFMSAVWKHTAPYSCRPHFETVDLGSRGDERNKSLNVQELLLHGVIPSCPPLSSVTEATLPVLCNCQRLRDYQKAY